MAESRSPIRSSGRLLSGNLQFRKFVSRGGIEPLTRWFLERTVTYIYFTIAYGASVA